MLENYESKTIAAIVSVGVTYYIKFKLFIKIRANGPL